MRRSTHTLRAGQTPRPVRGSCRAPLVIVPPYRQQAICGTLRQASGKRRRDLCHPMGSEWVAGQALPAPGPLWVRRPPTDSGATAIGRWTGPAALRRPRAYRGRGGHLTGRHGWASGSGVRTAGLADAVLRPDSRPQEQPAPRAEPRARGELSPRRARSAQALAGPGAWQPPEGASTPAPAERASCTSALGEGLL